MGCVFSSPFQRADTRIESEPFVVKNDIGDGRGSQREAAGFHEVYREHTDLSHVFCGLWMTTSMTAIPLLASISSKC